MEQDGSLCAQHCLNALLQGPYFTAVDLANIAKQLDETEESQLGRNHTTPYGFQNMDETGYFSIQVISQALQIWCLELVPFLRQCSEAERARENPAIGDPNFANQNATRNGTDSINRISTEEIRRNRQLFFDKFSLDSNTKG
ncbi:Ataxin-3 [Schistosoma japonicum]|nr:Ataxin-3 [Schistosoma japonicum]